MAMDHIVITVMACLATCAPMEVRVWDGDTAWFGDRKIRLTGYDTPERGDRASCRQEREKAEEARRRFADLLSSAKRVEIGRTVGHSYDRVLAEVRIDGRNVGDVLIAEGLATARMAKRKAWCR